LHSLSYATLEHIVEASVHGILLLETSGKTARIRYANHAYEQLSGYSRRELSGNAWSAHFAGDSVAAGQEALGRFIAAGTPQCLPLTCLCKDGAIWRSDVHLSRVGGTGGDASMILAQHLVDGPASMRDGEPPAERIAAMRAAGSNTGSAKRPGPPGSGMLSIQQFFALLSRDLAIARRHDRALTLILFEIAEYDVYRQTFGQLAAGSCARMIATQIQGTFARSVDLRARLDERTFVVVVHEQPEEQSRRLADIVAQKTARLSLPNPRSRSSRHVEVASTIVPADPQNDDAATLIERARTRLDPTRNDSVIEIRSIA
jgi:diguanylate cyclase (GGDEF)-like protein/PAS domain S-box-containing protein